MGFPRPGGAAGPYSRRRCHEAGRCSSLQFLHLPSGIHNTLLPNIHSGFSLVVRLTSHLSLAKENTVQCCFRMCPHVFWLVCAFQEGCSVCYCLKPNLALVCHTPVSEKVNSRLESTAFRSERRCVGKGGKTSWYGVEPRCTILTAWFSFMKNTYHVTMVLLFFLFLPLGPLQTGHSLWWCLSQESILGDWARDGECTMRLWQHKGYTVSN